jgi:hypothetical protein
MLRKGKQLMDGDGDGDGDGMGSGRVVDTYGPAIRVELIGSPENQKN